VLKFFALDLLVDSFFFFFPPAMEGYPHEVDYSQSQGGIKILKRCGLTLPWKLDWWNFF
jgi:hypothetical protein